MIQNTGPGYLTNSIVNAEQLNPLHVDDGFRSEAATTSRYAQAILTQSAGILLRLPLEVVATALVLLQRFWVESSAEERVDADFKVMKMPSSRGARTKLI
jgi:hypothetical protein